MATPVIEGHSGVVNNAASTTPAITMPSGVVEGELLLALVTISDPYWPFAITQSGVGWHLVSSTLHISTPNTATVVCWRIATATNTLGFVLPTALASCSLVMRISGANFVDGTLFNASESVTYRSGPRLVLPNLSKDYLYLVSFQLSDDAGATPTVPTGFTLLTGARGANGSLYVGSKTTATTSSSLCPAGWTYTYAIAVYGTLAVYQAPVISGTITDAAGNPLETPVVVIERDTMQKMTWYRNSTNWQPSFTTKADGTYSIPIPVPYKDYNLFVPTYNAAYADKLVCVLRQDIDQ